ncbi:MAG: hypothetical protein WCT46_06600 [Candidatus Gracilibacteria bacterium]|jgi:hypothetical protein
MQTKIPYKNPDELIEKVLHDLNLKLTPEEANKLKNDLGDILCLRLYKMFERVDAEDSEQAEKELEFESSLFYKDMIETYGIVKAYKDYRLAVDNKA